MRISPLVIAVSNRGGIGRWIDRNREPRQIGRRKDPIGKANAEVFHLRRHQFAQDGRFGDCGRDSNLSEVNSHSVGNNRGGVLTGFTYDDVG
jgi:hypothetical protein